MTGGNNMSPGVHECNVSEWHKFVIAIVPLVFPELDDWWGTRDTKAASVGWSVTSPTAATTNLAFPVRLLASVIYFCKVIWNWYFADAFPYKYKTQHYQQRKVGTGTSHLADRCRKNSWKITGWSHGIVSIAMHCLGYNKLTPDGSLANHVFDAAAAAAVF